MMTNGHKPPPPPPPAAAAPPDVAVQMTGAKVMVGNCHGVVEAAAAPESRVRRRGEDVVFVLLRLLCVAASVTAMASMVTARQASTASVYGFQLQLNSKWSFSYSFEYLVGATAAAAAYSLLQLLIGGSRLLTMSPVIASGYQAWILFAGDQIFAYAVMSAGSAASGVSNLNRTGIRHTALPNFCKALDMFCDHITISIVFTFFSCVLLAASAVQDVFWLSKY
ncbi:hypothetical protein SLEP1_g44755 [Rubroshorea leprosula]|uniref:CASP-like protein n=1 Tax=Rubroshorea leprosula TaxID=152421 RepID=A0AAV5LIF4_9ROSI|nr:hypothetical protein SLEP1_g44755 [Rubroshorea leprosula]